jgi:hypothetical protein
MEWTIMPRSRYGNGTENWKVNGTKTLWTHINNPMLQVRIRKAAHPAAAVKYIVLHNHPAPKGTVIDQPVDYAKTMIEARRYATKHLKHWNNPWQWASDPDFGKRGKQG